MTTISSSSTTSSSAFDLDVHVLQRYSGEARLQRLLWIADHSAAASSSSSNPQQQQLQLTALRAALTTAMEYNNCLRYKEIHHSHHPTNNNNSSNLLLPPLDAHWLQEAEAHHRHQLQVLQNRLQTAQAHLQKDAVRTAYHALAQFFLQTGDLGEALHAAVRSKDYCTHRTQTAQASETILALALLAKNYAVVREYVPRVEHTVGMMTSSSSSSAETASSSGAASASKVTAVVKHRVQTAAGLERLAAGDYAAAAAKLATVALTPVMDSTTTTTSTGSTAAVDDTTVGKDWDSTVLCPEDLALYAAVLALSHGGGDGAWTRQLAEHHQALERAPVMREVLRLWDKRAAYGAAWALLEAQVWPVLAHDLYFQQPVAGHESNGTILEAVQEAIRHKAIGQFWKPYHNCPLATMAEQLGPGLAGNPTQLEETVVQLLKQRASNNSNSNPILPRDTRLDLRTHSLVRELRHRAEHAAEDRCVATTHKLHHTSTRVLNDTYAALVRLACLEQDLVVQQQDGGGGKRGRGGRGSGEYARSRRRRRREGFPWKAATRRRMATKTRTWSMRRWPTP